MTTRFGVLGAGKICHDFVLAIQHSILDAKVVAVACSDVTRGKEFAKKFNIPRSYGSYEELFDDQEVDVVYNGLVNNRHVDLCIKAAEKKKHILCEKPLGMSTTEVHNLIVASKVNNVFMMEGIWSRCMPSYALIKKEIAAGTIGKVQHISVSFEKLVSGSPRVKSPELGGGAMFDIGIYPIQFAFHVMPHKELKSLHASGGFFETGVDKCSNITMVFSNGVTAFLTMNADINGSTKAIIYGDKGTIEIPEFFWCPSTVIVNNVPHDFSVDPQINKQYCFDNSAQLAHEVGHVIDCLKAGKLESDLVPHEETLAISQVMNGVLKQLGV